MNPKQYHVCWPLLTAERVEPVVSNSWASCSYWTIALARRLSHVCLSVTSLYCVQPNAQCTRNLVRKYEGRSINKLQNGAIPLILKIGKKIRNIRFVVNLILKIHRNCFDDDVIIVTSSVHRTQSICELFSPPVFYHNSQVINSIGTRKKRISLTS